jgi:hypothetical protein
VVIVGRMKTQGLALVAFVALVGCKGNAANTAAADTGVVAGPELEAVPTGSGWHCGYEFAARRLHDGPCFRSSAACDDSLGPTRDAHAAQRREDSAALEAANARVRADQAFAIAQGRPVQPVAATAVLDHPELPLEVACRSVERAHCMTWRDVAMNVTRFFCGASLERCELRRRVLQADNEESASVVRNRAITACAVVP